jgi:uncharacterized membrane protein
METEGIGELLNYIIICGFFVFTGLTFLLSGWMANDRRMKIRKIIAGSIFIILFVIAIYKNHLK